MQTSEYGFAPSVDDAFFKHLVDCIEEFAWNCLDVIHLINIICIIQPKVLKYNSHFLAFLSHSLRLHLASFELPFWNP